MESGGVCHVIATPYPGRGHINSMMNLCNLLVSRDRRVRVTFVATEEWQGLIGPHAIADHDRISIATIPNVIPSETGRAADFPGFIEAVMSRMEAPYDHLLDHLQPPPTIILADTYLVWAVEVGRRRHIPVASLWVMSATALSVMHHWDLLRRNQHFPVSSSVGEARADYIPGISSIRVLDLVKAHGGAAGDRVLAAALHAVSSLPQTHYLLFTSVQELEPHPLNFFKSRFTIPVYSVGPAIPCFNRRSADETDPVFRWLDGQPAGSVLYVSMGSFLSVPEAQMEEIAAGLQESGVRHLWVTRWETSRFGGSGGGRRLAVAWCDQLGVLRHRAVGGFWTHCGWNSAVEGAYAGVPMLTWPIFWDQPPNSKIIVEDWGMGARLGWAAAGGSEVVRREQIARSVKEFMDAESEAGKEMRKRGREIGEICRRAMEVGGSSHVNIDAFVREITEGRH